MSAAERRMELIRRFDGKVDTLDISRKDFRLCFPTPESIAEFIRTTGPHIHGNEPEWGDRITISEVSENPWG